jgi:hypothetical protein
MQAIRRCFRVAHPTIVEAAIIVEPSISSSFHVGANNNEQKQNIW